MDSYWLAALALLCLFEGLMPLLFPRYWQRMLKQLTTLPANQFRQIGGVLVTIGLVILYWL